MNTWSIAVDCSGGDPSSIWAKEVEWNGGLSQWDLKSGGNTYQAVQGSTLSWNSDLKWYHADISVSGHYSFFLNGSTQMEGYKGKKIDTGDRDSDIDDNTIHRSAINDPHQIKMSQVNLDNNIQNKSSSDIRGEIVIGDIPVGDIDIKNCADTDTKLITVNGVLDGFISGYTSAVQTIEYLAAKLGANPLFAKMMVEIGGVSFGTATPVGAVTPTRIGQLYVETTTPKLYVAKGLTDTDWFGLAD